MKKQRKHYTSEETLVGRGGEGTAEEPPPAGRLTAETKYFPLADKAGRTHPILGRTPTHSTPSESTVRQEAIDSQPVIAQYGVERYIG
jgi:hypothetical protein